MTRKVRHGTGGLRDFTVDLGTFENPAPRLAGATLVGCDAMRDPALVARLSALP